jgi:dolichyl-phosphate beta-glucosyltransferase
MKISVVVPAYNEAQRILPSLDRILSHLQRHHPDHEVIVVDDGSTDNTVAAIQEHCGQRPQLRILSYRANRGKGYAVRTGAVEARGDLVLFSDADLSTPIEELEKMLPLIRQGCDLVIGTRAHARAEIRRHQPLYREAAGKLFNLLVRWIVGLRFRDTQCGFKLFRRDSLLPVLQRLEVDRFAFDVELIALAQAAGLTVAEVPVVWINSPESTVGLLGGLHAYTDLLQIRRRARRLAASVLAGQEGQMSPPAQRRI